MVQHRPSRYNFSVHGKDGVVALFNAATGAVIRLEGRDAVALSQCLTTIEERLSAGDIDDVQFHRLRRGGFVVPETVDEVEAIQERYWRARGETPVVLTITTTMDCNLGCYYCYEERSGAKLERSDVSSIVDLARQAVENSGKRALHVDWYGGEPLLNASLIESASSALQSYCAESDVKYVASIISNGTSWPEDVEDFVTRHRIRQVQISFDGLRSNHNKRRRYRKGQIGSDSFARAVDLVDKLVRCTRVDVRFNIDRGNQADLIPFIDFAEQRGWFEAAFPAVFQPARLSSYSGSSAFMRRHELTLEEFDILRARARGRLDRIGKIEESELPDGVLLPKTSVCAALASSSVVIGAEGRTYRCGLQVGENKRAVGAIASRQDPDIATPDKEWWETFDPTLAPTCSRCSFLPVCWGGCPKKHLEGDDHALREQGRYWRNNLPRLVAATAGLGEVCDPIIPEELQFR